MANDKVTVKSKSERGRWRAGMYFTREGRDITAEDNLSREQLRAIASDPELIVMPAIETENQRIAREAIEKIEAGRIAAEKAEADRVAAEKAEADRAAAEKKASDKKSSK